MAKDGLNMSFMWVCCCFGGPGLRAFFCLQAFSLSAGVFSSLNSFRLFISPAEVLGIYRGAQKMDPYIYIYTLRSL